MTLREMLAEFVCPGCVAGNGPNSCESAAQGIRDLENCILCEKHVLGTMMLGVGSFALGVPRGFNRPYPGLHKLEIVCWSEFPEKFYNGYNIPVWYKEEEGHTFVRVVSPRTAKVFTHVISGLFGERLTKEWPAIINVGKESYAGMD